MGDDGADEEQDEADRSGRPHQWHADEAEQQSDRPRRLQGTQRAQPRLRHARLGHAGEDPLPVYEGGDAREGVGGDGQEGDSHVGGKHGDSDLLRLPALGMETPSTNRT